MSQQLDAGNTARYNQCTKKAKSGIEALYFPW